MIKDGFIIGHFLLVENTIRDGDRWIRWYGCEFLLRCPFWDRQWWWILSRLLWWGFLPMDWWAWNCRRDGICGRCHCHWLRQRNIDFQSRGLDSKADYVFLAIGFVHPYFEGLLENSKVELDSRGNVSANVIDFQTSQPKYFAAGDVRRGQSLVVWAISEGRNAARAIHKFLRTNK